MIFGEEVRYLIEMSIVEKLYIEIEERLEKKRGHTFTDYINNARKKYLKKRDRHPSYNSPYKFFFLTHFILHL